MFGGRIQPINGRVDATHGLSVNTWPGDEDLNQNSNRRIFYSIPMGYIEGLFQMQNWERKHDLQNWKEFHIPRTGAVSIHLNCFTTMPWEEEVHDITSTIAEDWSLSKPDEPARKRRESRTGSPVIETKGYGEERKPGHPSSGKIKAVPPDRPQIKSRTQLSAAVVHRNFQSMKRQQDEARARTSERVIEEMRRADQGSRKSNMRKEAIYNNYSAITDKSHDFNHRQILQQKPEGENLGEETSKTENQNRPRRQSLSQLSMNEVKHPRIRGLKRAANADIFRPTVITWPKLRSRSWIGNDNGKDNDNSISTSSN